MQHQILGRGFPSELSHPEFVVASGDITNIGASVSDNIYITGSDTITSLGNAPAGIRRNARFASALILTHNATSLILPTSANITTAANDYATFLSLGSGKWVCTNYQLASGAKLVSGISTIASGSLSGTNVVITSISQVYSQLILQINGASHNGGGAQSLQVQVSTNNGTSYDTTAANYLSFTVAGTTLAAGAQASLLEMPVSGAANTFTSTTILSGYQAGPHTHYFSRSFESTPTNTLVHGVYIGSTSAVNALKILLSGAASFDAGTYVLYGLL